MQDGPKNKSSEDRKQKGIEPYVYVRKFSFNHCRLKGREGAGPLMSQDGAAGTFYKRWHFQDHGMTRSMSCHCHFTTPKSLQFSAEWEFYLGPEFSLNTPPVRDEGRKELEVVEGACLKGEDNLYGV